MKKILGLILAISLIGQTIIPISIGATETEPLAADTLSIGDYVNFGEYNGFPVKYLVAAADDADGDGNDELLLITQKIIMRKNYSVDNYAIWSESTLRTYLNSDDAEVEYADGKAPDSDWANNLKTSGVDYYQDQTAWDSEPGFLTNLTDFERSAIVPVTHKSVIHADDLARIGEGNYGGTEKHEWYSGSGSPWHNVWVEGSSWKQFYTNYDGGTDNTGAEHGEAYYQLTKDWCFIPSIKDGYDYDLPLSLPGNSLTNAYSNGAAAFVTWHGGQQWMRDASAADNSQKKMYAKYLANQDMRSQNVSSFANGVRAMFFIKADTPVTGAGTLDSPCEITEPYTVDASLSGSTLSYTITNNTGASKGAIINAVSYTNTDGTEAVVKTESKNGSLAAGENKGSFTVDASADYVKLFVTDADGKDIGIAPYSSEKVNFVAETEAVADGSDIYIDEPSVSGKTVTVTGATPADRFSYVTISLEKESGGIAYKNQLIAEEDGKFSVSFNVEKLFGVDEEENDKIGGWYTLTVSSSEAGGVEKRVGISDESVMLDVVDIFNGKDAEKIAKILGNDEEYMLEYSALPKNEMILSDINAKDIEEFSSFIPANMPEGGFAAEGFAEEFNKIAVAFIIMNAEKAEDKYAIIENEKYKEIIASDEFIEKDYYKDLKEAKADIFGGISIDVIADVIENAIMYLANNAENPEELMEIIELESDAIGIELDSDYKKIKKYSEILSDMYFEMMGDFDSYEDIVDAFESAKENALEDVEDKEDGSGISYKGGGGGSSRVIKTTTTPAEEEPETEPSVETAAQPFSDIADLSYGIDAINRLYEEGIISGDGNGLFRPYDTVLREEFSKMLSLAFKIESEAEIAFDDVSADAWYHPYIRNLYGAEIINGVSETAFGVGQQLTRQDLAVMLYRYLGVGAKSGEEKFGDDDAIADYAKEAVYALNYIGIINGYDDGNFYPQNFATRQETAQLIWKTRNYIDYGSEAVIPGVENNESAERDFLELLGVTLDTEKSLGDIATRSELVYLIMRAANISGSAGGDLDFRDVKADFWAYPEISAAAKMGIVDGYSDGAFGINKPISTDEAAIIAMRAIGFTGSFTDSELKSYFIGIYNDILKGIKSKNEMTIEDAYVLAYNMLHSEYPRVDAIGVDEVTQSIVKDSLFMESAHDVYMYDGRVEANQYTSIGISATTTGEGMVQIDGVSYKSNIATSEFIGLSVDYYLLEKDGEKIVIFIKPIKNADDTITLTDAELVSASKSGSDVEIEYELAGSDKTRSLKFPLNAVFVYNGTVTGFKMGYINGLIDGDRCGSIAVINDGGSYIVRIDSYATEIVKGYAAYTNQLIFESGKIIEVKEDDYSRYISVSRNGQECELKDLKKKDIVLIKESADSNSVIIEADDYSVEGTITAYMKDKYIEINRARYDVSNSFAKNMTVKTGQTSVFFFDIFGKVAYMNSEDVTYEGKYAFLATVTMVNEFDGLCKMSVFNTSGEMEVLEMTEEVNFNGTKTEASKVADGYKNGTVTNALVYYNVNGEGKVNTIHTPQSGSSVLSLDIPSTQRRYLTPFFANGTAETDVPLFYLDADTILFTAPATDADKADFRDENNYDVGSAKSYFKDYQQYVVEAYNLNDFNVAEFIILRDSAASGSEPSSTSQMIVTNVGITLDEEGNEQAIIEGANGSGELTIVLKEDVYGFYTDAQGEKSAIKRGDIIKYAVNNRGLCNYTAYVGSIYSIDRAGSYSGKTNSQNFLASGTVVDAEGSYLKIKFGDGTETTLYGLNTIKPIICDSENDRIFTGEITDIQPGDFVFSRSGYSYLKEIFVIK